MEDININHRINLKKIEKAVKEILEAIGKNPSREGLREPPKRVAKMYAEIFSGLQEDERNHVEIVFEETNEEIVL